MFVQNDDSNNLALSFFRNSNRIFNDRMIDAYKRKGTGMEEEEWTRKKKVLKTQSW